MSWRAEKQREMIGRWQSSGRRGCHWLPYLKEMRRAEEGSRGRERVEKKKRERERGCELESLLLPGPVDGRTFLHLQTW